MRWTKPSRLEGRRPVYEGWIVRTYFVERMVIAAALLVSGIVWGLGQGWLVPVVFALAAGTIIWWYKLLPDGSRKTRRGNR